MDGGSEFNDLARATRRTARRQAADATPEPGTASLTASAIRTLGHAARREQLRGAPSALLMQEFSRVTRSSSRFSRFSIALAATLAYCTAAAPGLMGLAGAWTPEGPAVTVACAAMALLLLAAGVVTLYRPTSASAEAALLASLLAGIGGFEALRYASGIAAADLTPSITVVAPLAMVLLGRLPMSRALGFVCAYLLVAASLQAAAGSAASSRSASLWLLEAALLGLALWASQASRIGSRRAWQASLSLADLAYRDGLTGLANRRALIDHFHRLTRHAARADGGPHYLALLDLDHFKHINDSLGHGFGDRVLSAVAGLLSDVARRPLDMAARIGGEEFVLLLHDCPADAGRQRIEALLSSIRQAPIGDDLHPPVQITCSAGAGPVLPGMSLDDMLRRADHGLYQAKHSGRDRLVTV